MVNIRCRSLLLITGLGGSVADPDPGSNNNKKEGEKKIWCLKKFHKIKNYFIFEQVQKTVLWRQSRGAESKLPPRAGAEITNCGSGYLQFTTYLTKFYRKGTWLLKKFLYIGTV
jgi:hypothetical protein